MAKRQVGVATLLVVAIAGATEPDSDLRILVLEGEGSINNMREHTARAPVVRVLDASERPVAGATVNFTLPDLGAAGYFPEGRTTLSTTTDLDGRAVGRGLRPNNVAGRFQIRVSASSQGRTASAVVNQINVAPAPTGGGSKTKYVILALIGGGAVGAALALKGGGSSSSSSPTPTLGGTIITPGSPVFGPPH